MIDLDTLLYGDPTPEEVVEFFKNGEFHEEHYEVAAIKTHLRTPEQKKALDDADLSIEDCLNGRVTASQDAIVSAIFVDWNKKLGFNYFGG